MRVIQAIYADYEDARSSLNSLQIKFRQREADLERAGRLVSLFDDPEVTVAQHSEANGALGHHVIRVNFLGAFRASIDGAEITDWNSAKAKAIFTYLVNHPRRRIPREQLIEKLWPLGEVEDASNSLRVAIHALRRALATAAASRERERGQEDLVLFENGVYLFGPTVHFAIDVEEFDHHWRDGQRLERIGGREDAIREYELAEATYQGDFLQDDPYEEWSMLKRESLKDAYLSILGRLSESSLEVGNYERCILLCQKIIESDPCREDTYQRLMRAHMILGQPGRARRWFQICVRVLKEELELAPSGETVRVYRELFGKSSD
jgi:DNA-binding SARP family transcriptional activator